MGRIIMIKIFDKIKNKDGFAILFAVTLSAILLSVALGVANIATKEVKFSTSNRFSNEAFFAADTGAECAFYNDRSSSDSFLESGSSGKVDCLGQSVPLVGAYPSWAFILDDLGSSSQGCAKVYVYKEVDPDTGGITTTITSKGYNIGDSLCESTNANRIEREIQTRYGSVSNPPPPPPIFGFNLSVSKNGTGTGTVTSSIAGISCGFVCSADFESDSSVSLSATPDAGSSFAGWGGDCSGLGSCDLVMSDNRSVTATFSATPQVSFVGANSASGTSVSIPSHQAGDLIVIFAYRDVSNTPPSLAGGWINISSGGSSVFTPNSSRLAYTIAGDGSTTSGTWTNASAVVAQVYRGQSVSNPIGTNNSQTGFSSTVTYPSVSLQNSDGTSWVAGFAGHRNSNTNLENAPSGMTNRTSAINSGAAAEVAGHDTVGGTSSWSSQGVGVGGTTGAWMTRTLEIRAQ